jgi:hypothetical protein
MGRFSLSFLEIIVLSFIGLSPVYAKKVEGVKLPESILCEGKQLPLQGYGIRKATVFGIKIYVLGYYADTAIKKSANLDAVNKPICFDIYYLKEFDDATVDKAWVYQFEESSMYPYDGLKSDVEKIKKFFGAISGVRKQSFVLTNSTTKVAENGSLLGAIDGPLFQKNFLSIWFGDKPPTKELQEQLMNLD